MNERIKHSKLGIASIILAIGIWIYLTAAIFLFFRTEFFTKFYNSFLNSKKGGMVEGLGDLGMFILFLLVLFVILPALGHLLGFIFGLIGCVSKTRKILLPVIGVFLNILPFVILVILYLISAIFG